MEGKNFFSKLFGGRNKLFWSVGGVVVLVIIGAVYFISPWSPFRESNKSSNGSRGSGSESCDNLNTSSWQTYDKQGFSVKYPQDWASKDEQPAPDSPQWMVSFGPKSGSSVVWIGTTALDLPQFKTEITSTWVPGFDIDKEEAATIDGKAGTKLTAAGHAASYKSYIYYIPVQNNIAYMFQGPAIESTSQFKKCEPQIYQEMLETFKFPTAAGQAESGSGSPEYTNDPTDTSFNYPSDWEIKQEYFYETAAGEKATVPTIILGRKSDPANATSDQISINLRQASCEVGTPSSQEDIGGIIIKLYSLSGQNTKCVQTELQGRDVNGKKATYTFVSFFEEAGVLDVFKGVVSTFKVGN